MADVKSTQGVIHFDVSADGLKEMTLNQIGLMVGEGSPSANLHVLGNAVINALSVGNGLSSSNLHVGGTYSLGFQNSTSNISVPENGAQSVYLIDSSSTNVVVTLPYAGNVSGRSLIIKKTSSSNKVWVLGGGNTIDHFEMLEMADGLASISVVSSSGKWFLMSLENAGVVASSNLVAWYTMNESSGSIVSDATGNGYDATVAGFTLAGNSILAQFDRGIQFGEARSSYLNISNSGEMTTLDDLDYSISSWYYPDVIPPGTGSQNNAAQGIMVKAGYHHGIAYTDGSKFTMEHWLDESGTNRQLKVYSAVHAPANFYHVVGTFDLSASTLKIYVNGQLEGTNTYSSNVGIPSRNNTSTWKIGVANPGSTTWAWPANGVIDDVKVYNKVLSLSEVQELFQANP